MTKSHILVIVFVSLLSGTAHALSPQALQGQQHFRLCNSCHDTALNPPKGPPMWGVKRQYLRNTLDRDDFISTMTAFVSQPSTDKVIHTKAFEQMGLMPAMPLPTEILHQLVAFIYEFEFAPPCDHWEIAVQRAEARGDLDHAEKDRRQLNRFCRN